MRLAHPVAPAPFSSMKMESLKPHSGNTHLLL